MDILEKDRQIRTIYYVTFISLITVMILIFCLIVYKHYDDLLQQRNVVTMFAAVETPTGTRPGDTLVYEEVVQSHSHTKQTRDVHLLARTNHQVLKLYLDGELLFESGTYNPNENPGREMFFVALPPNYAGKTLRAEITSPYNHYHGRMTPIFVSDLETLNYYVVETSMRSAIVMVFCVFVGVCTIVLTLWQAVTTKRDVLYKNIFIGLFVITVGVIAASLELIVYKLLSPLQMSAFSVGVYLLWQVPFCWFSYFSCNKYRKLLLPAALAHTAFVFVAYTLQGLGIMALPSVLDFNNLLLTIGFFYIIVIFVLEARDINRYIQVVTPFAIAGYLNAFYTVYFVKDAVRYDIFINTILVLMFCMVSYNVIKFFRRHYVPKNKSA